MRYWTKSLKTYTEKPLFLFCFQSTTVVGSDSSPDGVSRDDDARGAARLVQTLRDGAVSRRSRRHSLSVTQDLASLSQMVRGDSTRRRLNNVMSFLDQVGKRSPVADSPVYSEMADLIDDDNYIRLLRDELAGAIRRRLRQ